jgi:3-hydroxyacyl-[acyl-carrier-protein] dehydratase
MKNEDILELLPYKKPFLFVDEITKLDEDGAEGHYTFPKEAYFYEGHFPENPITPGVLLIECMAQIGLVAYGIHLMKDQMEAVPKLAFTSSNIEFYKMVLPNERVFVKSQKKFFRLGKLKCTVEMHDEAGALVAKGELSGMMLRK